MDPMTDALVILGLSYAGRKATDVLAEFMRDMFGPSVKAAGQGLAASIEAWKLERQQRAAELVLRATAEIHAAGAEAQSVPGRILWPLLEKGSLEEDDTLRARWIRLLANAGTGKGELGSYPAFVQILSELAPIEAHEMARWYRDDGYGPHSGMTVGSIKLKSVNWANLARLNIVTEAAVELDLRDLQDRLGRLERTVGSSRIKLESRFSRMELTALGAAFLVACMSPVSKEALN